MMKLKHGPLVFGLCLFLMACQPKSANPDTNKKPIQTYFFKKNLSLRHAAIQFKYFLNKKPQAGCLDSLLKGWNLTFSDDFDSFDSKKWRKGQPWGEFHPGHLHQYYDQDQIQFKNGYLYLGGTFKPKKFKHHDSLISIPYAVGLINSDISFKQKYGYFAIRSKNPKGAATWPAFWLTGAHAWPPEIDIFEMYGRKSGQSIHNQYYTIHWGKANTKSRGYLTRKVNLPNNSDSIFHIYACEWSPTSIQFYTDGRLTGFIRINKALRRWLDDEMVVIINNSFDEAYLSDLSKPYKGNQFIVDWVRIYTKNGD